jgi:integrase
LPSVTCVASTRGPCSKPIHRPGADALGLCLHFGLRKKEALTLEVGDVDFSANGIWLRGERTKAKRDEFLPGNDAGMALLQRLLDRARESGQARPVLYRKSGKCPLRPVNDIASWWLAACERAGLPKGRRFHDARAAYITAIAKSAPAPVVQDLARHRDFETTMRYIRVADEARRQAVARIPAWSAHKQSSGASCRETPRSNPAVLRTRSQDVALRKDS